MFKNKFYQQKDGRPMSITSPNRNVYVHFWKQTFTSKNLLVNSIHFWARYVDDIIRIWKGSDRQLTLMRFSQFLLSRNQIHSWNWSSSTTEFLRPNHL